MKRGEVYWIDFPPPARRRPALILTATSSLPHLNNVTVAEITGTVRRAASQAMLTSQDGMPETCAVNLHNIQTISQSEIRARNRITTLSPERMVEVAKAIKFALELD